MGETPLQLIVRQRPVPHPELESLVGELHGAFRLDAYTTRQRLLGPGLVQLAQGGRAKLDAVAGVLRRHGYNCWVMTTRHPVFAPPRLRALLIGNDTVDFHCEGGRLVRLEPGMVAVGVLADLSGELAGHQIKRMLARNAYLGREQAAAFTPEEIRQSILKEQPVFDCYLLDEVGTVAAAFRALPGRFNPEGLGARASLGATRNLEAVIKLVSEYAGRFRLHTDFGLGQIPGCQPQPARENPLALQENLEALTRYGWLVTALDESSTISGVAGETPGVILAAGMAAVAGMAGTVTAGPGLEALATAIEAAAGAIPAPPAPPQPIPLPPPPERPEQSFSLRRALPFIAVVAGGICLAIARKAGSLHPFFEGVVRSGALPAVITGALAWWGFVCLRLKRHIEDTPTSRIRSLAMGLVEVQGRALRRYALVAPMTQGACVWYRLRKYRRDSHNRWQLTSQSDSSHVPFVLADTSGRIIVDPAGATVKSRTEQVGSPGENTLIGAALDGGPDEKWVEELIYEGTTLYVLGYARPAREVGGSLRERTLGKLRQLKLDPRALRRYDANSDGRLDADEWQTARDDVEQLAAAEHLSEREARPTESVLLGRPPAGLPFLIAEGQTGVELAGRYGLLGVVLLLLATAGVAVSLKLCLEFFRVL